ncbi:hypothetical protein RJT34_25291 [Clitoria ternatea]|uniref:MADS-box domain-containing protein n=1 Tax=Clitoria ternatea TaxID=43366 RepID=A0AAN9FPM5_CLITE
MNVTKQRKKTTGRKKIEIKKLDKDSNKQVTFSKRRTGLFKKASELCILCNVHVAMIVFSPADKLFCFGQPNVETIIARYLGRTDEFESSNRLLNSVSYEEYNKQYEEAIKILDLENNKLAEIQGKIWNTTSWWNEPINHMNGDELQQFIISILELRKNLIERARQVMMLPILYNV